MTYPKLCGNADNPLCIFKPLVSADLGHTERSWVNDTAKVFVQDFCEKGRVTLPEGSTEFAREFDLRGIEVF